ncbi:unnamed protein product [Linum trigynum]|uniref:Uncharacterized protein n=1 Tax=Linum trigynum TaxID=586398 RepID=A0AAV2GL99_9ROSI
MAHPRLIKQLSIVMIPLLVMILTASAARLGKTAVEAGGGCEKVTCPAGQICVVQCLDSCQPVCKCNETGGDQGEKGACIRGEKGRGKGRKAGKGKCKGQGNQSGDDEGTH